MLLEGSELAGREEVCGVGNRSESVSGVSLEQVRGAWGRESLVLLR